MRRLTPEADPGSFLRRTRKAERRILLLDYDGTLAPFREARDEAVPYPGVRAALQALAADDRNRLVVISGRAVEDLIPLLDLDPAPELWGSHGLEHREPDGRYRRAPMDERSLRGLAEARRWAERRGMEARAEEKPGCLALHLRGLEADAAEDRRAEALELFRALSARWPLEVHDFDGGVELRVPGRDKGHAVRTVLGEAAPGTPVAYLGDDLTDEDAFEALEGRGLRVLVRAELRPTAADVWLRPPDELLAFLRAWGGEGSFDPPIAAPEAVE